MVLDGYPSGGAGYAIGKTGLKMLIERGFANKTHCASIDQHAAEDTSMGYCMQTAGVKLARDAYDSQKRELFHSFPPEREYILPWKRIGFYRQYSINRLGGDACCSEDVISFHYVKGPTMLFLDYLFTNFTHTE